MSKRKPKLKSFFVCVINYEIDWPRFAVLDYLAAIWQHCDDRQINKYLFIYYVNNIEWVLSEKKNVSSILEYES